MRGAYVGHDNGLTGAERFIPTYVGHTHESCWAGSSLPVHPHIRGAYPLQDVRISKSVGSSPHTWGIPCAPLIEGDVNRFIPTYVGHTLRRGRRGRVRLVHPHIRGAYIPAICIANSQHGSSPHTWGIPSASHTRHAVGRFIPTYVGHTLMEKLDEYAASVHPHIRGAYSQRVHFHRVTSGSSPHTWGILPGPVPGT